MPLAECTLCSNLNDATSLASRAGLLCSAVFCKSMRSIGQFQGQYTRRTWRAAMAAACACAWNSGDVASMAAMGEWYIEDMELS